MSKIVYIPVLWELNGRIESDYEVRGEEGPPPCPHATKVRKEERQNYSYPDTPHWFDYYWTIPRVLIVENEGGYNSTGVCIDCLIPYIGC